jgi:hypothetical protein
MNVQLRDRKRQILIKHLLELSRHMAMEGWTYEDAFVCWAIRLAAFEGQPADMPYLLEKTGLTRQTIQRRLEANRQARNIAVHWIGKRKHYEHTKHADRQVVEYYAMLEGILNNWCEEAYQTGDANDVRTEKSPTADPD